MGSAKTRFVISNENPTAVTADGLIIPVFKKPEPPKTETVSTQKGKTAANTLDKEAFAAIEWPITLDKALLDEVKTLATEEKFDGSRGKMLTLRGIASNKLQVKRLIILGLGEQAGNPITAFAPRHWEANALKAVAALLGLKDIGGIALLLPPDNAGLSIETALSLAVDAVAQATYKSTEAKDPPVALQKVTLLTVAPAGSKLDAVLAQAEALAQARSLVKDLVNRPANRKTTETLVSEARQIGKETGLKVTVQSDVKWIAKNMPCFYTVARGSLATDPPKFITLQYAPKSGKAKKHIAVVGKSVIFDTGGYQVKPGDYMVTMKGDMTGGAVALATMRAIAALAPENIAVTAYLAATPNKIDSDAMVPDSIVDTTCGKKVEIRHTDAEGRLTLIDAVAKAVENKPDELITIATLTGSASQAVGCSIALMGNNDNLRNRIEAAGNSLAEPIQTLDVREDDFEAIKSKLDGADIINTSQKKQRGAQSAAAFVMSGAPETLPMAHMDIAGADMTPDEKATGIAVKTVIQFLLNEDATFGGTTKTPKAAPPQAAKAKASASKIKSATRKPAVKVSRRK